MSKDYRKKCSNCQTEIIMSDASGKWQPMETDNAIIHRCLQKKDQDKPPPRPIMNESNRQQQQPTPSVSVNTNYEILELKRKVAAMEVWIKKVSESAVFNT